MTVHRAKYRILSMEDGGGGCPRKIWYTKCLEINYCGFFFGGGGGGGGQPGDHNYLVC